MKNKQLFTKRTVIIVKQPPILQRYLPPPTSSKHACTSDFSLRGKRSTPRCFFVDVSTMTPSSSSSTPKATGRSFVFLDVVEVATSSTIPLSSGFFVLDHDNVDCFFGYNKRPNRQKQMNDYQLKLKAKHQKYPSSNASAAALCHRAIWHNFESSI